MSGKGSVIWLVTSAVLLASCGRVESRAGSLRSNFTVCSVDDDCGSHSCLCGVCSKGCDEDADCAPLADGARCAEMSSIAACGARRSGQLCLASCPHTECGAGFECQAGACAPAPLATQEGSAGSAPNSQGMSPGGSDPTSSSGGAPPTSTHPNDDSNSSASGTSSAEAGAGGADGTDTEPRCDADLVLVGSLSCAAPAENETDAPLEIVTFDYDMTRWNPGSVTIRKINNAGTALGDFGTGSAVPDQPCNAGRSFIIENGVTTFLPDGFVGIDINDHGVVGGTDPTRDVAQIWRDGVLTTLQDEDGPVNGAVFRISNSDQLVVQGYVGSYLGASIWVDGTRTFLGGQVDPADANDRGEAVGWARHNSTDCGDAWLWKDGALSILPPFSNDNCARASAINNAGVIVGASWTFGTSGTTVSRLVKWIDGIPTEIDLGVNIDLNYDGGLLANIVDINDDGKMIGWADQTTDAGRNERSFVLSDVGLTWLADAPGVSPTYTSAMTINNAGDVGGIGRLGPPLPGTSYGGYIWRSPCFHACCTSPP